MARPSRDGAVAAMAPKPWPKSLDKAWRVDVGEGYSSPVVSRGRAFVHSRRDPDEIVTAIDLATGKVLWQQQYGAAFQKNQIRHADGEGPELDAARGRRRVYTLGGTGVLSAWNTADGALAWRKDYSASVDTSKLFCGTAMSPMLDGGSVIVQVGSDVKGGRVIALDPADGRASAGRGSGQGPGYASPLSVTTGGVKQIVTLTNGSIDRDRRDDRRVALVGPVPGRLAREHRIAGLDRHAPHRVGHAAGHARRTPWQRRQWQAAQAWKNPDVTMYMSSPVFADGRDLRAVDQAARAVRDRSTPRPAP